MIDNFTYLLLRNRIRWTFEKCISISRCCLAWLLLQIQPRSSSSLEWQSRGLLCGSLMPFSSIVIEAMCTQVGIRPPTAKSLKLFASKSFKYRVDGSPFYLRDMRQKIGKKDHCDRIKRSTNDLVNLSKLRPQKGQPCMAFRRGMLLKKYTKVMENRKHNVHEKK